MILFFILFFLQEITCTSLPVEISANRLEYIKKEDTIICRGNVTVVQGNTKIKADMMRVKGDKHKYIKCFNNVKIIDTEKDIVLTGDFAEYYSLEQYAKMSKNPVLKLNNNSTTVRSELMERFIAERRAVALGNVIIKQEDITTISERAVYFEEFNRLELDGKPVLKTKTDEYRSERMVFLLDEKKVILIGDVEAKITPK